MPKDRAFFFFKKEIGWIRISDVQCPLVRHQTSNSRLRRLDIRYRTSNRCPMSDVRCPMSDVRCPMSDVWRPMSDIWCPISDVCCLLSDVWPMDIGHLKSVFIQFLFKKKKLGLLACYSFEFNFGRGISLGFVGTFMGFYFPLLIVIHVSLARESPLGE